MVDNMLLFMTYLTFRNNEQSHHDICCHPEGVGIHGKMFVTKICMTIFVLKLAEESKGR